MPKVPETATKNIPRICVSDSITGVNHPTIDDLLFSFKTNPAVYMSIQEVQPFLPPNILDFRYNNEHWFIHDTLFSFIGFMDISTLITDGD